MSHDLFKLVEEREYNYSDIFNHPKTIKNTNDKNRTLNFVIGVKGMTEIFRATLENIIAVKNQSKNAEDISIIVVEQDEIPLNDKFCNKLDVEYIFIPLEISNTEDMHSTALMYNVGFLFTKEAEWNIFHCADLLIPQCYFNALFDVYIPMNAKWVQCFTGKKVIPITPEATEKFLKKELSIFPENFPNNSFIPNPNSGAPGGSIMVRRDSFLLVGGYDAELFFGYTFEDGVFWYKLESLLSDNIQKQHSGKAIYADDPPIEVYHLQGYKVPPPDIIRNKHFNQHREYFETFLNGYNFIKKMAYIRYKRQLLAKYLNLHESKN